MNKRFKLLCVICLWAGGSVFAQNVNSGALNQPPKGSTWTVAIKDKDPDTEETKPDPETEAETEAGEAAAQPEEEESQSPRSPVKLVIAKGLNNVTRGEISYKDGRSEVYYAFEARVMFTSPGSGRVLSHRMRRGDPYALKVDHFPATTWIGEKHLKEVEETDDGKQIARYFVDDMVVEGLTVAGTSLEAWVAQETLHPIRVIVGKSRIYEFGPVVPYEQNIAMPQTLRDAHFDLRKKRSAMNAIHRINARQNQ